MRSAESTVTTFSIPDTMTRPQCPVRTTVLEIPLTSTSPPSQTTALCSSIPLTLTLPLGGAVVGARLPTVGGNGIAGTVSGCR